MKICISILMTAAALCWSSQGAQSAATQWQDIKGGRVRLVAAEPAPGEKSVMAMLQVDLAPGWKTYWRDPGDAGVPLELDVPTSANATLATVEYPTPQRFDDGVSVWAGYARPVNFMLRFERKQVSDQVRLNGKAFLGVCEKICVPVLFDFSLDVKDSAVPTVHGELVAMANKDLPKPATPEFGVSLISTDWHSIRIEAKAPEGATAPELFLAAPKGLQFAAPTLVSREGSTLVFEASITALSRARIPEPIMVGYTLVSDAVAVSAEIALSKQ